MPEKPTRNTKRYLNEVIEFQNNSDKWAAVEEYSAKRGFIFKIITEKDLLF
jgi:hypothetical protein